MKKISHNKLIMLVNFILFFINTYYYVILILSFTKMLVIIKSKIIKELTIQIKQKLTNIIIKK